ncbi:hypothetical protein [Nostoc sp. CMAA1605]|uniref:hypothetical protein n=1 Tax=Nostoc sp. CMAA1605 TaxID=2055159 RepID=UPI001F461BA9|nr:hypothetical protein [Nostoc sp. CMAA1605]
MGTGDTSTSSVHRWGLGTRRKETGNFSPLPPAPCTNSSSIPNSLARWFRVELATKLKRIANGV